MELLRFYKRSRDIRSLNSDIDDTGLTGIGKMSVGLNCSIHDIIAARNKTVFFSNWNRDNINFPDGNGSGIRVPGSDNEYSFFFYISLQLGMFYGISNSANIKWYKLNGDEIYKEVEL